MRIPALLLVLGCGSATVQPTLQVSASSALTIGGQPAAFQAINGSYGANCFGRSGAFSARVAGYAGALPNAALSVVVNDTACVLTITSIRANGTTYFATTPIALTDAYIGASATAFGTNDFFANAKLSAATFDSDFTILLFAADDIRQLNTSGTADYVSVSGTAVSSINAAPDYAADVTSLAIKVDFANKVISATGSIVLTVGAQAGEGYVISNSSAVSGYVSPTTISSSPITIPVSALSLVGVDLSADNVSRHIIIAHTQSGVTSYQVISIALHPATP